jgi:integrase
MKKPVKRYRSSESGTFMVDREIRGVGRIHRASGLTNEAQFRKLNDGIGELATSAEGLAALRAFKDGTISGVQLFVAIKSNALDTLGLSGDGVPLMKALETWHTDTEKTVAKATHQGRAKLVRYVGQIAKPTTRVADLPKLMRKLKMSMASAREFNLQLQYASAFARDTLGRRHEVYLDIRDIDVRKTSTMTKRHPLSPRDVLTIAETFARVWKSKQGSRGDEVFAMALTGMGPTEYWGRWSVKSDRVHIDGPKRESRVRDVPKLFPCVIYDRPTIERPAITLTSFNRALNIASIAAGIDCTPYDLRRTFGNWMEAAGILRSRRRQYLGHAIGDVSERYERHEVTQHLIEDAAKLRAWIAASIEAAPTPATLETE